VNKYPRISRISKNCSMDVYFDFIGKEFPLKWKRPEYTIPNTFKTDAHIDFEKDLRSQFFSHFGKDLVREIFNHADTKVDIPPGIERECYLLTTVNGTNMAFLMIQTYITDIELEGIFIDVYEELPLIMRIPSEHTIRIRFVDDLTDERQSYSFKLKIPITTRAVSATVANLRFLRSLSNSLYISSVMATVTFFIAIYRYILP
jgi:hypothetical protein